MFASIEDSDSDPDNHGEDSSSNTSADDHMTTKRSQCRLQGAGVKEVREVLFLLLLFISPNLELVSVLPVFNTIKLMAHWLEVAPLNATK